MSSLYSGFTKVILNASGKMHPYFIQGVSVIAPQFGMPAFPESIAALVCLLQMRPGVIRQKMQRKVVKFVGIFKNVSVVFECFCLFCIFASSDFMEKRKKLNAQR